MTRTNSETSPAAKRPKRAPRSGGGAANNRKAGARQRRTDAKADAAASARPSLVRRSLTGAGGGDSCYDFRFVHRSSTLPSLPQADGTAGAPPRITPPFLTKYEYARAVGARASMIANNEPLLVDAPDEYDPVLLAEREMRAGLSPLVVRRFLPHHTDARPCYEDWNVQELLASTAGPHARWYGVPPP